MCVFNLLHGFSVLNKERIRDLYNIQLPLIIEFPKKLNELEMNKENALLKTLKGKFKI